jgi:hypothetical protein
MLRPYRDGGSILLPLPHIPDGGGSDHGGGE